MALALIRPQDRLIACELEPRAAAALKGVLRGDRRAKVLARRRLDRARRLCAARRSAAVSSWSIRRSSRRPISRGSASVLAGAHRKWPTGIYVLWYPIKEARRARHLGAAVAASSKCRPCCAAK